MDKRSGLAWLIVLAVSGCVAHLQRVGHCRSPLFPARRPVGQTAFLAALEKGQHVLVKKFMSLGVRISPDELKERDRMQVVFWGLKSSTILEFLKLHRYDGKKVENSNRFLYSAAEFDMPDVVRFLLETGADANGRGHCPQYRTPLVAAIVGRQEELLCPTRGGCGCQFGIGKYRASGGHAPHTQNVVRQGRYFPVGRI